MTTSTTAQAQASYRPLFDAVVGIIDDAVTDVPWHEPRLRTWRDPAGACWYEMYRFASPLPPVPDLPGLLDDVNHQLRARSFRAQRTPIEALGGHVVESADLAGATFLLVVSDRAEVCVRVPLPDGACGEAHR